MRQHFSVQVQFKILLLGIDIQKYEQFNFY